MSSMFQQRKLFFRTPSFSRKRNLSFKIARVKHSTKSEANVGNDTRSTRDTIAQVEALKVLQEILQKQQVRSVESYTLNGITFKVQVLEDTEL